MALEMFKGNRLPLLQDTITVNGNPFDLTGSTVLFSMRPSNSATLKVSGSTATIVTAASGTVSYAWASTDVDTVGTFAGWWTYNMGGKSQDTPEFDITFTEHTPPVLSVLTPVATDGTVTIVQGDAYLNAYNRALTYELSPYGAPDLTATSSVTIRVSGELHQTGTVIDKSSVRFDLTSTQTAGLAVGEYAYQIETLLTTGSTATLFRGNFNVLAQMVSP